MVHLFNKSIELGILASKFSTVWEDTYGCEKQYRCALAIYLNIFIILIWDHNGFCD